MERPVSSVGMLWDGAVLEFTVKAETRAEFEAHIAKVRLVADSAWPVASEQDELPLDPPRPAGFKERMGLA